MLVDAKTTEQLPDRFWRWRLPRSRQSHMGTYTYEKNYADDCDLLSLVALYEDGRPADFYILPSENLPTTITIRRGGPYEHLRNDWSRLKRLSPALQA